MKRFHQAMVVLPPLLLLVVGIGTYIAVERITAPRIVTLKATGTAGTPTPTGEPSSSASVTPAPTTTPITTEVPSQTPAQISALQEKVATGQDSWRLDPLQTAKQEGANFGFTSSDDVRYDASSPDLQTESQKNILVTHGSEIYRVIVNQPGLKGAKGVWVIQSIQVVVGS